MILEKENSEVNLQSQITKPLILQYGSKACLRSHPEFKCKLEYKQSAKIQTSLTCRASRRRVSTQRTGPTGWRWRRSCLTWLWPSTAQLISSSTSENIGGSFAHPLDPQNKTDTTASGKGSGWVGKYDWYSIVFCFLKYWDYCQFQLQSLRRHSKRAQDEWRYPWCHKCRHDPII